MARKIDSMIGLYSLSKTLRFKAIPVGKTQEYIQTKRLLEEDEQRAKDYLQVKKIIDRYHKEFIERVLSELTLEGIEEYISLLNKNHRSDEEEAQLQMSELALRSQISNAFKNDDEFKKLFGKEIIKDILPSFVIDTEEKRMVASFSDFTTAFVGFHENRKNMYSEEAQVTAISYRCINENLPKYAANIKAFEKIRNGLAAEIIEKIEKEILDGLTIAELFIPESFNLVLTQKGIDLYNLVLGGMVLEDGTKIQGLNEYINLYNQQLSKDEGEKKIPQLMMLYKQILSDKEQSSYYAEGINSDTELIAIISDYLNGANDLLGHINKMVELLTSLADYSTDKIYYQNGLNLTGLSQSLYGRWNVFASAWNDEYDAIHKTKKINDLEKYEEKRSKEYKKIKSFSLLDLDKLGQKQEPDVSIVDYLFTQAQILQIDIEDKVTQCRERLSNNQTELSEQVIRRIKEALDAIKTFESFVKPLKGSKYEADRDDLFYGEFENILDRIEQIDTVYNQVRNYVTRKPFSAEKFKLYFQNVQLLGGWSKSKERDYKSVLLRKKGMYYLAIIDKQEPKVMLNLPSENEEDECYEKLNYCLLPDPSKMLPKVFFSEKGRKMFCPNADILRIYREGTFKKGSDFSKEDCSKLIEYYISSMKMHEEWSRDYNFVFKEATAYEDISAFYADVDRQGYKISFDKISASAVDALVEKGNIYLFQIYNKDFSTQSHGTPNLHTLYFKELFSESNLETGMLKLCGGGEFFMRRASLAKDKLVVHPAGVPIKNKNPLNPKKESVFEYDIFKNKRYSEDQYELHIPITINRVPQKTFRGSEFSAEVRKLLKQDSNPYVIGIDRGERNLLYICVIDGNGDIVEQMSLNEIISEAKGVSSRTDYHALLENKEKERMSARQNWTTIENIKELKEGYISQVVHVICQLVNKYDAVIAMEDLNSGFKNSRVKVEKQIYQKFEKALIEKLNYMVDKQLPGDKPGSVSKGFQLTEKFTSFRNMRTQNGFIFYIPAWLTSKIDPTTGFVNLLKIKYNNMQETREFIKLFDAIIYDSEKEMFCFKMDYEKFPRTNADYRKKWDVYTNGERIKTFRNPQKNNEWDNEMIDLTSSFKALFDEYHICYENGDLRTDICNVDEKDFYVSLIELIRLTFQMRNSISGRTDVDFMISPVMNNQNEFYDSRVADKNLPKDADANGAYNIARKVLWAIDVFRNTPDDKLAAVKIAISNAEWLEFAQK